MNGLVLVGWFEKWITLVVLGLVESHAGSENLKVVGYLWYLIMRTRWKGDILSLEIIFWIRGADVLGLKLSFSFSTLIIFDIVKYFGPLLDIHVEANDSARIHQEPDALLSRISPPLTVPPAWGAVMIPAAYRSWTSSKIIPSHPRAAGDLKRDKRLAVALICRKLFLSRAQGDKHEENALTQ